MKNQKVSDIDLLLSKLDKKKLCEFIRKECANNREFKDRFLSIGAGIIFTPKSADYRSRVKRIIKSFQSKYGYVEYRDTFSLNRAIAQILDEADEAMQNQKWEVALAIIEGIASTGEEIINCGDDSAGELGSIVDECFTKWHELCNNELLPSELKSKIFKLSISYFTDEYLKGWDWWWDWIEMAISVSDTTEQQNQILKLLNNIIDVQDYEWGTKYNTKRALQYKLEIISINSTPEEQRQFMYENVSNPEFRKKLLQMAWDEGNYDEVLRLAKEGILHDSDWSGLVADWHKWELKIYRQKNDKENILKLSQYFFFERNVFEDNEYSMSAMYTLMKSTVPTAEWCNFVDSLLKEAYKNKTEKEILFIYTQEKMWSRYMEYLQKNYTIHNLDNAPHEVWTLYNSELIQLYTSCIKDFFKHASNRNEYNKGVNLLRKLIKYGGTLKADEIITEQKNRIPRRPALIEELSQL